MAIGQQVLKGSHAVQLDTPTDSIVAEAYQSYPSQIAFVYGQSGTYYMSLNNAHGPFRNINLRRAVWAGLDRQGLAQVQGGSVLAEPMTHFIDPGMIGYEQAGGAAGPQVDYNDDVHGNLAVARKYMKLAGYPTGRYTGKATIQVVGADSYNFPEVTAIANRALTSLGFRTHVIEADYDAMYTHFCSVPKREIDVCTSVRWVRDFADPASVLTVPFYGPAIVPTSSSNWSQVNDPAINAAIAHATLVNDPPARAIAWARVDRMLVDDAVAAPETVGNVATIESRDVAGVDAIWNMGVWDLDYTSLR